MTFLRACSGAGASRRVLGGCSHESQQALVLIGIQPPSFELLHECEGDVPESRLLSVVGRRLYVYLRSPYCCPMLAKGYRFPDSKSDREISVVVVFTSDEGTDKVRDTVK